MKALRLTGLQVIVTGSSGGIGEAIARAFANAGGHVACVARSADKLKTVVEDINGKGKGKAIAVGADVASPGGAQKILSQVEAELGPVDVLVNNAGIARIGALIDEPEDTDIWWRVYEVNVRAPVTMIRAVLPSMLKRKTGYLISTSSSVATMALPGMSAYASSKAAISKFHQSLSLELKDTGITTFAVHPGVVNTNLGQGDNGINQASMEHPAVKAFLSTIDPNHHNQEPQLCANLMVALSGDDRFKKLSGHHLNVEQDLEAVITDAEKGENSRIQKENLYVVNIGAL